MKLWRRSSHAKKLSCTLQSTLLTVSTAAQSKSAIICRLMAMTSRSLIAGDTVGILTVVEAMEKRDSQGCVRWLCRCECGNLTVVISGNLVSGHTTSCGCIRPVPQRSRSKIAVGYVSGQLTVIEEMLNRDGLAKRWLCRCECGQLTVVRAGHLVARRTTSCGCSRRKENR